MREKSNENIPLTESKPILSLIAEGVSELDNKTTLEFAKEAIAILQPRQYHFDSEDTLIKKELANVQAAKEDFVSAARTLEKVSIDQSDKSYRQKVEIWLSIAENWFEADDSVNAEKYVNKAAFLMHHLQNERELQIQYRCFNAKILDSKRQFNLAAWKYYHVSN
mmetsp:Transcript_7787/g.13054  ORF Transcript_7787/g.13054 Transcript_7787/m.13054 type:complete len:165 (+) Transcript_7787:73-567(+)